MCFIIFCVNCKCCSILRDMNHPTSFPTNIKSCTLKFRNYQIKICKTHIENITMKMLLKYFLKTREYVGHDQICSVYLTFQHISLNSVDAKVHIDILCMIKRSPNYIRLSSWFLNPSTHIYQKQIKPAFYFDFTLSFLEKPCLEKLSLYKHRIKFYYFGT